MAETATTATTAPTATTATSTATATATAIATADVVDVEIAEVDVEENKKAAIESVIVDKAEEVATGDGGDGDDKEDVIKKDVILDLDKDKDKDKEDDDGEILEEQTIYDSEIPNRIIVGRNHPLSFYVDRARRVLRIEEEVHITGRGDNISTACKLVEALKRQKIAIISKISTGMNVEPYFNQFGDARWGQPAAVILFKLKRGEFGKFIADYQQRKIIEIFENNDEKNEGMLSVEKVESLQFASKFKANSQQIEESKGFLSNLNEKNLNLPTFIKYASILIHPLLKNKIFKDILSQEFDIEVSGGGRNQNVGTDDHQHIEHRE